MKALQLKKGQKAVAGAVGSLSPSAYTQPIVESSLILLNDSDNVCKPDVSASFNIACSAVQSLLSKSD